MPLKIIPYLLALPVLLNVSVAAGAEGPHKGETSGDRGQQALGQPGASPDSDKNIGPASTDSTTSSSDKQSKKSITKSKGNKHDRESTGKSRTDSGSDAGNADGTRGSTDGGVGR